MTARKQTTTSPMPYGASFFPLLVMIVLWTMPPDAALAQQEEIAQEK